MKPVVSFRTAGRISGRKMYQRAGEIQDANQRLGKIIGMCLADLGEIAAMAKAVRWWRPFHSAKLVKAIFERADVYKGTDTEQKVAGEKRAAEDQTKIINSHA